ncbi:MAG: hypothetical protein PHS84_02865 [Paludibacter sp.]|nr:hypothetical protein [Paludibacter sp.]
MKKLIISLFVVFLFIGCTVVSVPTCEQNQTFTMEFTNGTNSPYDLYINDQYQQVINARSKATYDIPSGYWSAEVVQISGYTLYPTDVFYSNTYESCTNYYIVF